MSDDFKIAGAYVEVNLRDNTSGDEKKIRARLEGEKPVSFETALKDPKNTKAIKDKIEATPAAKIRTEANNPIDEAWRRKIQASIKSAATGAIDIPLTPETELFRRDLEVALKKASGLVSARIPVSPEDSAKFRAQLEKMVSLAEAGVKAHLPVEVDEKGARDSARKAGKGVEDEMQRVAGRANAQFDALKFTALSAGLPAAAAVGAAGAGLALAAIPLLFVGIGAAVLKNNSTVVAASQSLKMNVVRDTEEIAGVLAGPLANAADDIGVSFNRMKPMVREAFTDSVPAVKTLTGAVTDLAENAMPGAVKAIKSADAPLQGVRSLAGQVGDGFTDMTTNMSRGSASAGQGLSTFGGIIQDLLGFTGSLFANLANGSAGPLASFQGMLRAGESALLALTASGSGALGFLTGFTNAGSGLLSILGGVASLLSVLPAGVTQFGGSFVASGMLLNKFGVDAGAGFEGLGKKIGTAEGAGNKFKTGMSGLATGALHPAMLATALLGVGLQVLGQHQADAAASAQAHRERVNGLASALRESNGAINENVRALMNKNLVEFDAGDGTRNLVSDTRKLAGPDGLGLLTNAYAGNVEDGKKLVAQLRASGEATAHPVSGFELLTTKFGDMRVGSGLSVTALTEQGKGQLQLADIIEGKVIPAMGEAEQKNKDLAAASKSNSEALNRLAPATSAAASTTANLTAAFEALNVAGGNAAAKGQALIDMMDELSGKTKNPEEALQSFNDHIRTMGDAFKDAKGKYTAFPKDMIDAAGAINTASEAGSNLQNAVRTGATDMATYAQSLKDAGTPATEIQSKLGGMRTQLEGQLKTLGLTPDAIKRVLDNYGAVPADIVTALRLEGDKETQSQLADVAAKLKALPPGQSITMNALTDEAIRQLGDLGQFVVKMPDGTFRVFANTAEGKAAAEKLMADTGAMSATATVYSNTAPAGQAVVNWQSATTATVGNTTTTTQTNPATNNVNQWKTTTDATGAKTTTYTNYDPATNSIRVWKQNTDGTWAETHARADIAAAEAAINNAARNRTSTIYVQTKTSGPTAGSQTGPARAVATGGLVTAGGVQRFAEGGQALTALDVTRGGLTRGPGGPKADKLFAMLSNKEFVINAEDTKKNLGLLRLINSGKLKGFADGGLVGAASEMLKQLRGDGQFFEDFSFYGNSDLVRNNNDKVAKLFYAANPGFDFNANSGPAVESWLEGFLKSSAKSSSAASVSKPAATQSSAKSGGNTINNYNTFNLPPDIDIQALASLVSRELEMRMKTGAYG